MDGTINGEENVKIEAQLRFNENILKESFFLILYVNGVKDAILFSSDSTNLQMVGEDTETANILMDEIHRAEDNQDTIINIYEMMGTKNQNNEPINYIERKYNAYKQAKELIYTNKEENIEFGFSIIGLNTNLGNLINSLKDKTVVKNA